MLVSNLNVSAIRTYGIPVRYSPFENQPIVAPNHRLLGVLKAGGPKGTEFAEDVTNTLTFQCAVYSVAIGRGFDTLNTRMNLFEVSEQDLGKCLVS